MVQVITFGCRLNAFESEVIKEKLRHFSDDLIVINTCAVTGEAERQCRQAVRKLKKENPNAKIVVTGCSAEVHADSFLRMKEVDLVLGNKEKADIEKYMALGDVKAVVEGISSAENIDSYMITGFEGRQKAFVQIQQGCNHRCTYCIVPYARGKNRSAPIENVVRQVKVLVEQGLDKICLTGVDLCSYEYGLANVVRAVLSEVQGIKELSFGSMDPAAVDDDLIDLIGQNAKILPYFHLSVQSGDNLILKRMGRRHTREDVIGLCNKIRAVRKDATFGADFICGFPTESKDAFLNTCKLVEEAGINKLHVFPYSERKGTPAAQMPQIDMHERRERAKILRDLRKDTND